MTLNLEEIMRYTISQEFVNALIQYLASKPYAEVFQVIQALQNLQVIVDTPNE